MQPWLGGASTLGQTVPTPPERQGLRRHGRALEEPLLARARPSMTGGWHSHLCKQEEGPGVGLEIFQLKHGLGGEGFVGMCDREGGCRVGGREGP